MALIWTTNIELFSDDPAEQRLTLRCFWDEDNSAGQQFVYNQTITQLPTNATERTALLTQIKTDATAARDLRLAKLTREGNYETIVTNFLNT